MGDTEPWLCSHGHYQGQDCGECAPMTDLPDAVVNAAAEAIRARGRQLLGPQGPGSSDSKDLAITALAAASGPWAEQLDAANEGITTITRRLCEVADERDAALARNAELEREVAAFRKSNEDWRATTGEAIAEQEAAQRESRSWESNYNTLKAENAHLRSRITEGLVCPTCKHDFADGRLDEMTLQRDKQGDQALALRAELDSLRETLAQKIENAGHKITKWLEDDTLRLNVENAYQDAAAIVRGSDDE